MLGIAALAGLALVATLFYLSRAGLDARRLRGVFAGLGLGLVNAGVGSLLAARAMRGGLGGALTFMLGGFFGRLIALVVLMLWFRSSGWADHAAFALTFLLCFFLFLGFEVRFVARATHSTRRPA